MPRRKRGGAITLGSTRPLSIASVDVAAGTPTGGTTVHIAGAGFTGVTSVTFGGTSASFVVNSDVQITVTTPAHALGAVDIVVANAAYHDTYVNGYTYAYLAPTLSSLNAASGTEVGGTAVTATGTHLIDTTGITINGVACTSVVVVDDSTVTFVTPAYTSALSSTAASNAKDVVLTNPAGSSTLTGGWTYTSELKRIVGSLYCKEHRANDPAIALNGGNVSSWPDYAGNGAVTQGTASKQPAFNATGWNGGPCITLDGVDDFLQANLTTSIPNGSRPYILIASRRVAGALDGVVTLTANYANYIAIRHYNSASMMVALHDSVTGQQFALAASDTNRHLLEGGFRTGGTNAGVIDGVGHNSTVTGPLGGGAMSQFFVGTWSTSTQFANADIVAIIVLNNEPTAQNLTDLRAAFKASTWIGYTGNSLGLP